MIDERVGDPLSDVVLADGFGETFLRLAKLLRQKRKALRANGDEDEARRVKKAATAAEEIGENLREIDV